MQRAFWNSIGYTIIQTLIYTHGCADCSHHLTAYVNSAVREKMITRITHCMLGVRFVHRPIHAHEGPRGLTRAHEGPRGLTRAHEGSRGPTRAHEGSRGLMQILCWVCTVLVDRLHFRHVQFCIDD